MNDPSALSMSMLCLSLTLRPLRLCGKMEPQGHKDRGGSTIHINSLILQQGNGTKNSGDNGVPEHN